MEKKYKKTLMEFKLRNKKIVKGLLINYSDDWTLLANNPVDFQIDGFLIINNKNIVGYKQHLNTIENEVLAIKFKKLKKANIDLTDSYKLFKNLTDKKMIVSIEKLEDKHFFIIGKVNNVSKLKNELSITPLTTEAQWEPVEKIAIKNIDVIEFKTDYIESLMLINK